MPCAGCTPARRGPDADPMSAPRLTRTGRAGLLVAIALFCLPLFIGLREWDMRSDEAIYSYAVDRILETGEWLTPRSIPTDLVFYEKPPLKFWLVAGGMRLGLLPMDDKGMRLLDVTLASIAFVYVYLLAWRLSGTVGAVVSVFVLFSFDPLIFEHGVRGNNMEAPLIAAYAGGIYHFVRWVDGEAASVRRRHALGVAAYFVLGFMTKFVAVLFLPLICLTAVLLAPSPWARLRRTWADWVAAAALVAAAVIPWFAYETVHDGRRFWADIFGTHVLTRFAGTLVPQHLQPWHHYLTATWAELGYARLQIVIAAGFITLVVYALRRGDWLARVCLVWCVLPTALISLGTSKLFYYVYPFFPPLAIGTGLLGSVVFSMVDGTRGHAAAARLTRMLGRWAPVPGRERLWLGVFAAAALVLAAWTAWSGPVTLEAGGVRLFRNSSAARVGVIGILAWIASGYGGWTLKPVAATIVALLLPLWTYAPRVARFSTADHPLRTVRDCALAVQARGESPANGAFHASGDLHHAYYYYLRKIGPWTNGTERPQDIPERLTVPGKQSPVLLSKEGYEAIRAHGAVPGFHIGNEIFILLPGPYAQCVPEVLAAGGQPLPGGSRDAGGR